MTCIHTAVWCGPGLLPVLELAADDRYWSSLLGGWSAWTLLGMPVVCGSVNLNHDWVQLYLLEGVISCILCHVIVLLKISSEDM